MTIPLVDPTLNVIPKLQGGVYVRICICPRMDKYAHMMMRSWTLFSMRSMVVPNAAS